MVFFRKKKHVHVPTATTSAESPTSDEGLHHIEGTNHVLTAEQYMVLKEVKQEFPSAHDDPRFGDSFFLRFIKARQFHEGKARHMLRDYFEWRDKYEVDKIVREAVFPMASSVKQYYPHGYHGVDKRGRPIYIEALGKVDVKHVLSIIQPSDLIQYFVQEYEHLVEVILPSCSQQCGTPVDQTLTVLDLQGLNLMTHFTKQTRGLVRQVTSLSQNFYPELLGQMIIVNAPTYFTMVWNFVKPLLDEKTVAKISFGSEKLRELVDPDQLPMFLGGTRDAPDWYLSNFGPWADVKLMARVRRTQTHVPPNLYLVALSEQQLNAMLAIVETSEASEVAESDNVATDSVLCQ
eukprot:Selendium_serpulae@DN6329_c0_g1_i3.p2